jgi:hypothetical protein
VLVPSLSSSASCRLLFSFVLFRLVNRPPSLSSVLPPPVPPTPTPVRRPQQDTPRRRGHSAQRLTGDQRTGPCSPRQAQPFAPPRLRLPVPVRVHDGPQWDSLRGDVTRVLSGFLHSRPPSPSPSSPPARAGEAHCGVCVCSLALPPSTAAVNSARWRTEERRGESLRRLPASQQSDPQQATTGIHATAARSRCCGVVAVAAVAAVGGCLPIRQARLSGLHSHCTSQRRFRHLPFVCPFPRQWRHLSSSVLPTLCRKWSIQLQWHNAHRGIVRGLSPWCPSMECTADESICVVAWKYSGRWKVWILPRLQRGWFNARRGCAV